MNKLQLIFPTKKHYETKKSRLDGDFFYEFNSVDFFMKQAPLTWKPTIQLFAELSFQILKSLMQWR